MLVENSYYIYCKHFENSWLRTGAIFWSFFGFAVMDYQTKAAQDQRIKNTVYCSLQKKDGLFFIECRSVNDPLYRKGDILSHTERVDGHYRRFIILEEIQQRLSNAGFKVTESHEKNGLAKFGDDDPVVIRLKAVKN